MKQIVLEKLEWPLLLTKLAELCQTDEGKDHAYNLTPNLSQAAVQERWNLVDPLRLLAISGYMPPVSELPNMRRIWRSVRMQQILSGEEIRSVYNLLAIIQQVHKFCGDFAHRCHTLKLFQANTYPLPNLAAAIEKTVGPDGELLDDASPELQAIRRGKLVLRKKIEKNLQELLVANEMEKYLQDKFFTLRAERYVVPMKLDGRGRIKGSIYDTSDSGQTLFIEPTVIAPLNEELLEIDLSEKLEIIRIFRALGEKILAEAEILETNYHQLIDLDFLRAQAIFAKEANANPVQLSSSPVIDLYKAIHPLVKSPTGAPPVANDIQLKPENSVLIISGPNAGGKTVILKTVGMLHLMAKAGLMIPAKESSSMYVFDDLHLELGDAQSLSASLSTFSGHIEGIKPIIEKAGEKDLVLLDELAAGTEPHTGAALAQAIVETLAKRQAKTIVTTHFDPLKALAVKDPRFRNGSMEFSSINYRPTYQLVFDIPGQSYGIEVAQQLGLSDEVVNRAKEIRGGKAASLDELLSELSQERQKFRAREEALEKERLEIESLKNHWERENEFLRENRQKAAQATANLIQEQFQELRSESETMLEKMQRNLKRLESSDKSEPQDRSEVISMRHGANRVFDKMRESMTKLQDSMGTPDIPGEKIAFEELKVGQQVYSLSLAQEGAVIKIGAGERSPVEIQIGALNISLPLTDLRRLDKPIAKKIKNPSLRGVPEKKKGAKLSEIDFTPQTSTNSLDLRGVRADSVLEAAWKFIDQALLRGESRIILIHGHGSNTLKTIVRDALATDCPYHIRYRPGQDQEGGDGVTVIALDV